MTNWSPSISVPAQLRSLIADLAAGQVEDDQRWLVSLMTRQGPAVVGMLWRLLGREEDVLDAYQSAICSLAGRGRDGIGGNRGGYFYQTAMNAGFEIIRRRQRDRRHRDRIVSHALQWRAESTPPGQHFSQGEAVARLRAAIFQLPPQLRAVIVLRELAGLPYRRVAQLIGIRVSTARLYRRQAIVRLAGLIEEAET